MSDKTAIRQEMRARRKALSPEAKARAARIVCDKILAHPDVAAALDPFDGWGALAVYLASPDEVDLTSAIEGMLARGITIVAPRWNGETYELAKLKSLRDEDLRKGPMGILEPKDADIVPPKNVAVWLVPGLAFTRDGKRLGYGGGWYDRLMAGTGKYATKFGVAYAFQIVEDLPNEPHDIRVNGVIDDSLEHPQVDYAELPDGCRVRVSIAKREKWLAAFFGGLVGVGLAPLLVFGCVALKNGGLPLGVGIALLIFIALAVLVGAIALLYAFGGPFEAELEVHGEKGVCRWRWLGLVPWTTRHFAWKPWTRFAGGGYAFYNAPKLSLVMVCEGAVAQPLFRTDSVAADLLSIRLNRSRVVSTEQVRAAREKLLAKLPHGMSIVRDADGATVSVWAPSLVCTGGYFVSGIIGLLFVTLLLLLLSRWPVVMVTLMALVALAFVTGLVYILAWGLFGRYRLTICGDECLYIANLFGWKRKQNFVIGANGAHSLEDSYICLEDTQGASHVLFNFLPKRYLLYLTQFIRQELERRDEQLS